MPTEKEILSIFYKLGYETCARDLFTFMQNRLNEIQDKNSQYEAYRLINDTMGYYESYPAKILITEETESEKI